MQTLPKMCKLQSKAENPSKNTYGRKIALVIRSLNITKSLEKLSIKICRIQLHDSSVCDHR